MRPTAGHMSSGKRVEDNTHLWINFINAAESCVIFKFFNAAIWRHEIIK